MRIIINCNSLQVYGGIERQMCGLATFLAARGHHVFLFTSDLNPTCSTFSLHKSVQIIPHTYDGDERSLYKFRKLVFFCEPDVCLSPASDRRHLMCAAALWGTEIPWVYSERTEPTFLLDMWNSRERLAAMAGADSIHMLLPSYAESVPEYLRKRVTIISNPVLVKPLVTRRAPQDSHILLAVGRLSYEKQLDLLIDAFSLLARDFPRWKVDIWGEGEEQGRLQRQIVRYGLTGRVRLCGSTTSPEAQYAAADFVCIPSRHEGLPGVVLEAMACGLPCVGFAKCGGTNELILHGQTGLLAEEMTAESLASSLRELMTDETARMRMGRAARERSALFAPERLYAQWEELLEKTAARKGKSRLHNPSCLAGVTEEERAHLSDLGRYVARHNIFLDDSQRLRLFVWRHPLLHKTAQTVLHTLRKVAFGGGQRV